MSSRHEAEVRTIHPRALAELGEEACIVALGVSRDLRSGVIPPESFVQWRIISNPESCGTPCCILGHIRIRLDNYEFEGAWHGGLGGSGALFDLFSGGHPSDPLLAADAIERYVYDGSQTPWSVS